MSTVTKYFSLGHIKLISSLLFLKKSSSKTICCFSAVTMSWMEPAWLQCTTELKPHTCHKLWQEPHEIGQTMSWPNLVWSSCRPTVILVMLKIIRTTSRESTLCVLQWPCGLNGWSETSLLCAAASVSSLVQQSACPCAPLLPLCVLCGQPLLPRGEDRAKPAGMEWGGLRWVGDWGLAGTVPPSPGCRAWLGAKREAAVSQIDEDRSVVWV